MSIPKEQQSKNLKAEEIVGKREGGTPFQEPWEMDYACPLCTPPITEHSEVFDKEGNVKPEYERLHFSEYQGFMWCEHCNADIPSLLCLSARSLKQLDIYTERYLELLTEFKARIFRNLTPEERDMQTLQTKIHDLENNLRLEREEYFWKKDLLNTILKESWLWRVYSKIFHRKYAAKSKEKKQK
jgi:hypothetical protein